MLKSYFFREAVTLSHRLTNTARLSKFLKLGKSGHSKKNVQFSMFNIQCISSTYPPLTGSSIVNYVVNKQIEF